MSVLLIEYVELAMTDLGYLGVVALMALESMVAPVPSELVMPCAGALVAQGHFTFAGGVIASSLGTIIGSLIGYCMGLLGGYPVVERFGRYLLLDREHLEFTARWFQKRGEVTVLVSRFIPVVRHFISIPAGVARMNLMTFSIYTLIGGTIWNTILLFAGVKLQENWTIIHHYSEEIDFVVVGILACGGVWWVRKQLKRRRAKSGASV
jgi:membrane protein DedA with SNARE-associated domain